MDDPIQIVSSLIRDGNVRALSAAGNQLRPLLNRRNSNIILHALIDQAAKAQAARPSADNLAMMRVFAKNGLGLNDPLDNGDLPLNALMARDAGLAMAAIRDPAFAWDLNACDRSGRTPLIQSAEICKSRSANLVDLMRILIDHPSVDLDAHGQGGFVAYKGLYWLTIVSSVAGRLPASMGASVLVHSLAAKGYDFNAAQATADVVFGSRINTPMAYCIKKAAEWMRWNTRSVKKAVVAEALSSTVQALISRGADPSLQMEPGQRVELMALCKQAGFPDGMMQALEAGVLSVSLSAAGPPAIEPARPRRL